MVPFKFLKYLQPTRYFSLKRKNGATAFPLLEHLPKEVLDQLDSAETYKSPQAQAYDKSWQALHLGHIFYEESYADFEKIPVVDEYRFIRRYFSKAWVYYVLLLRLISFKNPFKEISGFLSSKTNRLQLSSHTPVISNAEVEGFASKLVEQSPFVSVIIPTLNRYEYLKDVLKDLEKQNYSNFEVIVVDQSVPFQKEFYEQFDLQIHANYQEEKALWLARNNAIKQSKSNYLLLFDDDSRVEPDWIQNHLKTLDFFKADISSGVSISKQGDKIPADYRHFRIADQLDTGNVMIKRDVFKSIGLFDRQFEKQRMGDGEFGLRTFLNGYLSVSNPIAKRLHLKVNSGGLRDMGSWDAFRTKNLWSPRPIPSVLYYFRRYYGASAARLAILRITPISIMPYRFKKNNALKVIGALVVIITLPIIVFQIVKSWNLSGKKLAQGPLIEALDE
ncbi:glycosyltransferase [Winogradskyella sp. 3972H.M.0a.05]|uniref:glycosyltransferase family 2 protein n=1 Tax=Winogradskyella sp. 3972H.M.0a.05 TaxID=2950277 RepID=UPI00339ACA9D